MIIFQHPAILWFLAPIKMVRRTFFRFPKACLIALAAVAILSGVVELLIHHIDATRVYYKRLKAPSAYTFDKIQPYILKTDPRSLIQIGKDRKVEDIRKALVGVVWGADVAPEALLPREVSAIAAPEVLDRDYVSKMERLTVPVDAGYTAHPVLIHPRSPNGRLAVYQHGYAGVFWDFDHVLNGLLKAGFTVLANNYPGYGENALTNYDHPRFGYYQHRPHLFMSYVEWPLRYYFDPLAAGINHALKTHSLTDVAMIGFSAGGWATAVYAAIDTRIVQSYPVAGVLPLYAKLGYRPPEHYYRPLIHTANYLEMYVMAADRPGRSQYQIFNQYDRCCYRNRYGDHFGPAVQAALKDLGGGRFQVFIDTSHADHKISDHALKVILDDLAAYDRRTSRDAEKHAGIP